jgi:hypothetical protein
MPLLVQVYVEVMWAPAGGGNTFMEQQQASIGGQGQSQYPHIGRMAQYRRYVDDEPVPVATGSEGSVTVANIKTAIDAASTAIAGTGSPLISASELAMIQGWASGGT